MPSLMHRRLCVLEKERDRRDVPAVVLMEGPLSAEGEADAAAHRRRGSIVLLVTADDLRL